MLNFSLDRWGGGSTRARASLQLREPDNLRTFVSSPQYHITYGGDSMSREDKKSKVKSQSEENPPFDGFSRRSFLSRLGAAGAAVYASPFPSPAQTASPMPQSTENPPT